VEEPPEERWPAELEFVLLLAATALALLPGNVAAATSANTPVSATLPAMSQRFARFSRWRAASLVCLDITVSV
jgi:hypothetical protein